MSVFGWSYPPGAANDPNAPYNQTDEPCGMCGQDVDRCVCPECPVCGAVGDIHCYIDGPWAGKPEAGYEHENIGDYGQPLRDPAEYADAHHGLVRSFAQVALLAEAERQWREEYEYDVLVDESDYPRPR